MGEASDQAATVRALNPRRIKQQLRRRIRQEILTISEDERASQSLQLVEWCQGLPGFDAASTLMLYMPAFPEEVDTRPLVNHVVASGRRLVLPRVSGQESMLELLHVQSPAVELVAGCLGILEPMGSCPRVPPGEIDWVLVPGLAFDEQRNRLGRGAGHYDRLLSALEPATPIWALAFESQCVPHLPSEPHDQPVTGILTPRRCIHQRVPMNHSKK
jgi:5-formyltetrahydrofolate cyclo-ligase